MPFGEQTESGTFTPQSMRARSRVAEALIRQGLDTSPIGSHYQGLNRVLQSMMGNYQLGQLAQTEREAMRAGDNAMAGLGGRSQPPPSAPGTQPPPGQNRVVSALSSATDPYGVEPPTSHLAPNTNTADPYGVEPPIQPLAPNAPQQQSPPPTMTGAGAGTGNSALPRPIRINNPGAIEFGPFAQEMGATGSDGRFAVFPDMEAGYRAQERLLLSYMGRGINTVQNIIGRWAPANVDNNSTGPYITQVAAALGVRPDQRLTPDMIPRLAEAMAHYESGRPVPRGGDSGARTGQPPPTAGGGLMADPSAQPPPLTGGAATQPPPQAGTTTPPPGQANSRMSPEDLARAQAMIDDPRPHVQALGRAMFAAAITPPPLTEAQREHAQHVAEERAAGRTPDSFDVWRVRHRQASALTNNVDLRAEGREAVLGAEARNATRTAMQQARTTARSQLGNITLLRSLMDQPGFYSGAGGNIALSAQQIISQITGNTSGAASMEAFASQSNQMVMSTLGTLGANISNSDRDFITNMFPNISTTEAGNRTRLEIMERLARRQIEAANFMDQHRAQNNGRMSDNFEAELDRWREQNPIFSQADLERIRAQGSRGGGQGNPPPPTTPPDTVPPTGPRRIRRFNAETGQLE